ncbi:MAG: family 10 glycosylhydrolase [Bacteroidetes bacterium]|nr:family 10 glycosylhydrolase [Bacteroidota bacterium]MBK8144888.1 family 10 glycosylhydrolase [Bacteroidota bacterium]MBP6315077.1 family 10 glycosylhydrolase [Chitinophagaceae bacterium]
MIQKGFLALLLFAFYSSAAQNKPPLREFRAAWIATIGNIDWPSKQGLDATVQQQEFISIVETLRANHMNAVIVQIRPSADALYQSPYENWSRYLSGKQGVAPSPYYDPLAFMIEECHKRCLEFHAWFNPYRALVDATKNPNTSDHVTKQHPEWFVNYGGKKYFDPGLPEVRAYFTKIVLDVVKRYDIDAVHFDDYFYPYRIGKLEFPDFNSYRMYGGNFAIKDDWRRDNVNRLIESLSKLIKKEKPYVKFGISPFGVWRNASKDPDGSLTNGGQTNYDDLFADVILWQKKGWIDYLLPQLYWEIGHRAVDYHTLLEWWANHSYNRHMYIGHGVYKLGTDSKPCWHSLDEITHQITALRKQPQVQGSAFYSGNAFFKNRYGLNQKMREEWYSSPALLPVMNWLPHQKLPTPVLSAQGSGGSGIKLQWKLNERPTQDLQFALYRYETGRKKETQTILAITRDTQFVDAGVNGKRYTYFVTALDRLHNESEYSNAVE